MKKERMKIGELFEKLTVDSSINNEVIKTKKPLYIKAESGELIKLLGIIRKTNCKIVEIVFDKCKLRCASTHLLKVGEDKFEKVENLKKEDIVFGKNKNIFKVLKITTISEDDFGYDVTMEKEHVYSTPNGLLHHNSMLAIQSMGGAQLAYHGSIAAFLDSEEATTSIRMSNLGVRYPRIKPYTDITVEKVFKFLEGLCLFKEEKKIVDVPSIVVWDSIANTLSEKEREVDDVNSVIGYKARVLSIVLPKYIAKLSKYNISLVAVNQLRDVIQMGPYSVPRDHKFMSGHKSMPGGSVLGFNAFTLLEMKTKKIIESEKYGFDGIKVSVKSVKNKLFTPNLEVMLSGDFRTGFSNFWTSYDFLVETKRLKTGAWNFLINLPDKKFRTKDANVLYNSEQKFKDAFDEAIKDAIQIDIIERYNPEIL